MKWLTAAAYAVPLVVWTVGGYFVWAINEAFLRMDVPGCFNGKIPPAVPIRPAPGVDCFTPDGRSLVLVVVIVGYLAIAAFGIWRARRARSGARAGALLLALVLAGCTQTAPDPSRAGNYKGAPNEPIGSFH